MDYLPRRLTLVDPRPDLTDAFRDAFSEAPNVDVVTGRFEELESYDCMVSAANSFGLMDGGVDMAISKFFGWELMDRVQAHIIEAYFGEQPVGTSFILETGHAKFPYLAHTPTMRVPMDIRGTDNVYNAMLAMFRAVRDFNRAQRHVIIRHVACPGLGTATGRLEPKDAARQMWRAYTSAYNPLTQISWPLAENRQNCVAVWPNRRKSEA